MNKEEIIDCIKLTIKMSESTKYSLLKHNYNYCIVCKRKKEAKQNDCYYCSSCENLYDEIVSNTNS